MWARCVVFLGGAKGPGGGLWACVFFFWGGLWVWMWASGLRRGSASPRPLWLLVLLRHTDGCGGMLVCAVLCTPRVCAASSCVGGGRRRSGVLLLGCIDQVSVCA